MNEELIAKLKALGVSDAAIAILNEQEVTSEDALKGFTYEQLVALGIKAGSAKILANAYGPAPVAPTVPVAPPTGPQTIVVKTGKPADMSLRELVQSIADGEHSADYVAALRNLVGNKNVFVRLAGSEKIDVDNSLELIDHVGGDRAPDFWGDAPTETLDEVLERRQLANPITKVKLAKGDTWLNVSEERRILAAYGRLARLLTGTEDEYTLTTELQADKLAGRWTRIEAAFSRAQKSHDPLVDDARAAIYFRQSDTSRQGGSVRQDVPFRLPGVSY